MTLSVDRRLTGILFACGSYGLYTLHYATVKWLGSSYSLWQLIFVRSVIMFLMTLALNGGGAVGAAIASPHKLQTAVRATLQFVSGCVSISPRPPCLFQPSPRSIPQHP